MNLDEISKINIPPADVLSMLLLHSQQNAARMSVILSTQARILSVIDQSSTEKEHMNLLNEMVEAKLRQALDSLIQKY